MLLLFPLLRFKIEAFPFEGAVAKYPGRTGRHHLNAVENRSVFQDAAARNEFAQASKVRLTKLWTDRKNRFGFGGEIEGLFRLVIVDPVHPVAVIEERRRSASPGGQQSMKSSVQSRRKSRIVLVEVQEIGRAGRFTLVAVPPVAVGPRLGKILSGKNERDIAPLVAKRHAV